MENVEIIMEAGIEEISIGFSADKMDGEYGKSIEHYLPGLLHKLDVICKTGEVFEFRLNDVWVPARMEMGMEDKWYLVGLPD